MKYIILIFAIIFTFSIITAHAQTSASDADKAAITATALDYIEGWYEVTPTAWSAPFIPTWPNASSIPMPRAGAASAR